MKTTSISAWLSLLLVMALASQAKAYDISPYLDDGTFLVIRVSVGNLLDKAPNDLNPIIAWCKEQGFPLDDDTIKMIPQANGIIKIAQGLGIDKAYLFLATDDVRSDYGPVLLFTMLEDRDPAPTALLLRNTLPPKLPMGIPSHDRTKSSVELTKDKKGILLGTEKSVARYLSLTATERADLIAPYSLNSSNEPERDINISFSLGKDGRRVVRELWPTLPSPFEDLTGTLLADEMQHFAATIEIQSNPSVNATFAMADNDSAEQALGLVKKGLAFAIEKSVKEKIISKEVAKFAADSVSLSQTKSNVLLNLNQNLQKEFLQLVSQSLLAAKQSARRNSQLNSMKQVALAMHNFYDVNEYFPAPAAICDSEGKPLLSWRVAILPFVGQHKLYDQFHLNEPWNSPHNLKLAKQIPFPYQDLNHPQLADLGMTTLQRPVYEGSQERREGSKLTSEPKEIIRDGKPMYYQTPGLQFSDVIDGTSNTIVAVQVASEHAVVWTKPADWEVDLQNPKAKLFDQNRDAAITGWCDAHAKSISKEIDPVVLKKIITHNGKEVVKRGDY